MLSLGRIFFTILLVLQATHFMLLSSSIATLSPCACKYNGHIYNLSSLAKKDGARKTKMASNNICNKLRRKTWNEYDPSLAPKKEGIYCIGEDEQVIYVGTSINIRRRLSQHKSSVSQEIGKHVKEMFAQGKQGDLGIKWVLESKAKCKEGDYVSCMEKKLGYRLLYNRQKGNAC